MAADSRRNASTWNARGKRAPRLPDANPGAPLSLTGRLARSRDMHGGTSSDRQYNHITQHNTIPALRGSSAISGYHQGYRQEQQTNVLIPSEAHSSSSVPRTLYIRMTTLCSSPSSQLYNRATKKNSNARPMIILMVARQTLLYYSTGLD